MRDERGSVPVGGRLQRALLTRLLLEVDQTVSIDRLIEEVWRGSGSVKSVQVAAARLRAVVGRSAPPVPLVTREHGYAIELGMGHTLDQLAFEQAVADGQRLLREGELERAAERLTTARLLWRGPPLPEFALEEWALAEVRRLEELHALAVEAHVDVALASGRHVDVIPELERLIRVYPDREHIRVQLMLALYGCGRQSDALGVFQETRRHLIESYGIEPGEELRAVNQAIIAQDRSAALASARIEPLHVRAAWTEVPLPSRLRPYGPTRFVGREHEHEAMKHALRTAANGERSTVLILGEPGVGKTRLVSETACQAHAGGWLVLGGRCDEGLGVPYQPFVEALEQLITHAPMELLRAHADNHGLAVARLVPALAGRLSEALPAKAVTGESEQYVLFAAVDAPSTGTGHGRSPGIASAGGSAVG